MRAPISGRISDRRIDAGNLVSGGGGSAATLLTTINAVDPVYFEFSGSEALFLKARREGLDKGTPVEISLQDESDYRWHGTLDFTDNGLDSDSGTIRARAVVRNGEGFLAPGLFGPCGYGFPSIIGAKIGCPDVPVVGFAGDGAFGISMSEMSSIGREEWPAITMVVFRNYQWGAEKRNNTLWFDDNFVGTELDRNVSYAQVAEGCGLKGVTVQTQAEMTEALKIACKEQSNGVTTFIEVLLNQELGEPFRRDVMKNPVAVAGIDPSDMQSKQARPI